MTFPEAYNYIISFQNMPRKEYMKDPRHCGVYLKRLQFFLNILDNPERKIPHYIHVAGTSGKGSVTAFLHSILYNAGKKVGSTQSPHQTIITERWKIDKHQMSKKEFIELVEYIKPKLDEYIRTTPYDMLSFFEIIEAIGFLYFAKNKIKWVVLETGCGGRFDSTNIIPYKDVAVITNIGLDHVGIIGNNKIEIAHEKAGIIKKGCGVFTMEKNKKIIEVIEKECKKMSVIPSVVPIRIGTESRNPFFIDNYSLAKRTKFNYKNQTYHLQTIGKHQIKNAILCIEIARSLKIPESSIKLGLKNTKQPLRMEIVSKKPIIILDGAHNPDKIKTTIKTTQQINTTTMGQWDNGTMATHLVVGFSHDKNVNQMIRQLATLKPTSIACTHNTINPFRKVANPQEVCRLFKKFIPKAKIKIFLDPSQAFAWSKKQTKTSDLLLVTGSIFLAGEIKNETKNNF